MNRERKVQLLSLALIGACVALAVVFQSTVLSISPPAHADASAPARRPPQVQFVHPRVGSIRRAARMAAEIKPDRQALVYGQAAGYVQPHPVEVGTRVDPSGQAGEPVLLKMAVPELDAAVITAESRVAQSTSAIAEAEAAVVEAEQGEIEAQALAAQAEGMIAAARAALAEAQAELNLRQTIHGRLAKVVAESPNLVAQDQVDQAKGGLEIARAKRESAAIGVTKAEADARVARARIKAAGARIVAATAAVAAARAEQKLSGSRLVEAQTLQGFATILAPFRGVVAERMVDTGDLVRDAARNSGAMPLFRVVADDRLRARFFLAEPDCPACSLGGRVELTIDVLPGRTFDATITRIADALDSKTRTMEVEAELDNPRDENGKKLLRADMFARVKVYLEEHKDALIVPARCVTTKKRKSSVLVVTDDDTVESREVTIGVDDGVEIQIVGGSVTKDTRIVSRGANKVAKGEKVVPALDEAKE